MVSKFKPIGLAVLSVLLSTSSEAAIFNEDNRVEVTRHPRFEAMAQATALMVIEAIDVGYTSHADGTTSLNFLKASEALSRNLCSDERFAQQPVPVGACTGFLIAPDVLVTAGHCMLNFPPGQLRNTRPAHCSDFKWLFDYKVEPDGSVATSKIDSTRLVSCKRVIYASWEIENLGMRDWLKGTNHDYAVVQLERPLMDRKPFSLASSFIRPGESVAVVGHPIGLPAKASAGAIVLEGDHADFFRADLDVSDGMSGAPVVNEADEVVGILVRAYPVSDYVFDESAKCFRSNICVSGPAPTGAESPDTRSAKTRIQCTENDDASTIITDAPSAHIQHIAPVRALMSNSL